MSIFPLRRMSISPEMRAKRLAVTVAKKRKKRLTTNQVTTPASPVYRRSVPTKISTGDFYSGRDSRPQPGLLGNRGIRRNPYI